MDSDQDFFFFLFIDPFYKTQFQYGFCYRLQILCHMVDENKCYLDGWF